MNVQSTPDILAHTPPGRDEAGPPHVLPGASRENAAANSDYSIIPHGARGKVMSDQWVSNQ
jgi:hypothetical protein